MPYDTFPMNPPPPPNQQGSAGRIRRERLHDEYLANQRLAGARLTTQALQTELSGCSTDFNVWSKSIDNIFSQISEDGTITLSAISRGGPVSPDTIEISCGPGTRIILSSLHPRKTTEETDEFGEGSDWGSQAPSFTLSEAIKMLDTDAADLRRKIASCERFNESWSGAIKTLVGLLQGGETVTLYQDPQVRRLDRSGALAPMPENLMISSTLTITEPRNLHKYVNAQSQVAKV